jgi:hypothetical protein
MHAIINDTSGWGINHSKNSRSEINTKVIHLKIFEESFEGIA